MIRIKPHHLVDILAAFGRGQRAFEPHPYGHAVHVVAGGVLRDPHTLLEIELGADDICAPCKHNVNGLCDDTIDTSFRPAAPALKRQYNLLIDLRWCERLALKEGDRLTAREFALRVQESAANISDIYGENPPQRAAQRAHDLAAGVAFLLALSDSTRTAS